MASNVTVYSAHTDITITLASLASTTGFVGRESSYVDNSSNRYLDALVALKVEVGAGTISADPYVYVYAYASLDDGGSYGDVVTGTDAGITLNNPPNLRLLGAISIPAQSATYKSSPWSIAHVFGGVLPERWGIVVINRCGIALGATEGNHTKRFQGINTMYA